MRIGTKVQNVVIARRIYCLAKCILRHRMFGSGLVNEKNAESHMSSRKNDMIVSLPLMEISESGNHYFPSFSLQGGA